MVSFCHPVFERQPTLRGQLVELRPLRPADWDVLYNIASDPLIWEQHPSGDRYKEDVFRTFFQEALDCGGAFVVFDARTGAMIGSTRFDHYDEQNSEIEIGWTFLARSHWGGAHNGEMKRLMLEHAFKYVDSVYFVIGPDNRRSRRAVEKIGGVYEASRQRNGRDVVIYRIQRSPAAVR
jgi:RimJ/RimL family protein N-acetyltransferase